MKCRAHDREYKGRLPDCMRSVPGNGKQAGHPPPYKSTLGHNLKL